MDKNVNFQCSENFTRRAPPAVYALWRAATVTQKPCLLLFLKGKNNKLLIFQGPVAYNPPNWLHSLHFDVHHRLSLSGDQ